MNERRNEPHPLELEQWLLGEQTADARSRTESRLTATAQAQLRHQDRVLREQLFESTPAARFIRSVRASASAQAPARTRPDKSSYVVAAAIATAAVLLMFFREPSVPHAERVTSTERAKGVGLELRVYRQQGSAVERLADGAEVAPRQVVQLGFARGDFSHGVLFSIDGRGAVTLHYPREPSDASLLPQSGEHVLAEAYELDDAPAFERFIFVAARGPLPVQEVLDAAGALAADRERAPVAKLELRVPSEQRSLLVHKSAPR